MSHFTKVTTKISDMEALEKAIASMGLRLTHNAPCRYYYGETMKENVVSLPGRYDLSIEEGANGTYDLNADFYEGDVERTIGPGGSRLMRSYTIEKLKIEARKKGYSVHKAGENKFKIYDPTEASNGYLEATLDENGNFTFKAKGFSGKSCMKFTAFEKSFGEARTRETDDFYVSNGANRMTNHEEWG